MLPAAIIVGGKIGEKLKANNEKPNDDWLAGKKQSAINEKPATSQPNNLFDFSKYNSGYGGKRKRGLLHADDDAPQTEEDMREIDEYNARHAEAERVKKEQERQQQEHEERLYEMKKEHEKQMRELKEDQERTAKKELAKTIISARQISTGSIEVTTADGNKRWAQLPPKYILSGYTSKTVSARDPDNPNSRHAVWNIDTDSMGWA